MRIAIVVYDGVLGSECEAFTSVLGLIDGAELLTVGAHTGSYSGPGGTQPVDRCFHEVDAADVVVVPGGLGCERAADDAALREFLVRMERTARFVAASSTGSVVLASAGLLHGEPAATHWLAGDLLRRYGSEADGRRLVTTGNVITCEGTISAVDAAFALVERLEGPAAVPRIRATLLARGAPHLRPVRWWDRVVEPFGNLLGMRTADQQADASTEPATTTAPHTDEHPVTPLSVMVELVDNDELVRRMKRSSRRRR